MTVRELIALLQTMPPDALVITTYCSGYAEVGPDSITLIEPPAGKGVGKGLVRHKGHLMDLDPKWRPSHKGEKPTEPEYVTAVHFAGN